MIALQLFNDGFFEMKCKLLMAPTVFNWLSHELLSPLTAIYVISSYNVRVLNNSQLVVVLIGRLMRGLTNIACRRLKCKICP